MNKNNTPRIRSVNSRTPRTITHSTINPINQACHRMVAENYPHQCNYEWWLQNPFTNQYSPYEGLAYGRCWIDGESDSDTVVVTDIGCNTFMDCVYPTMTEMTQLFAPNFGLRWWENGAPHPWQTDENGNPTSGWDYYLTCHDEGTISYGSIGCCRMYIGD